MTASVPKPSNPHRLRSPWKYRAYSLESGRPNPNPARGVLGLSLEGLKGEAKDQINHWETTVRKKKMLVPWSRGEEIVEEVVVDVPADAAALVADLDGDVVVSLGDLHGDLWQLEGLPAVLHGGAHRVLEQLEQDVAQVHRGVHQLDRLVRLNRVYLCRKGSKNTDVGKIAG